jgi:hypothetical protein
MKAAQAIESDSIDHLPATFTIHFIARAVRAIWPHRSRIEGLRSALHA